MKYFLKEGNLFSEHDGKERPLECYRKASFIVPGKLPGSFGISAHNCGTHCPAFELKERSTSNLALPETKSEVTLHCIGRRMEIEDEKPKGIIN